MKVPHSTEASFVVTNYNKNIQTHVQVQQGSSCSGVRQPLLLFFSEAPKGKEKENAF